MAQGVSFSLYIGIGAKFCMYICICVFVVPLTLSCVVDAVKFFNDTGRVVFGSVLWWDGAM